MALELLSANITGAIRHERLEGRKHLAIPTAILPKEGVLMGLKGAYYYPEKVTTKRIGSWNGRPAVLYHPMINGQLSSAGDPLVFNSRRCGLLFNTAADDKIRTETWLDIDKTNSVDDRIIPTLERGEMIEISTGFEAEVDNKPGEFEGKEYKGTVLNIIPDHLAILPDQKGAYSVESGGGMLQFNQAPTAIIHDMTFIANELSQANLQTALTVALRDKIGTPGVEWWGYVTDVWQTFLVYYSQGKYYRIDYSIKNDKVKLSGDPQEVVRYTQWQTPDGTFVGNQKPSQEKETEMANPKEQVDAIIVANVGYEEIDRDQLSKMDPKEFGRVKTLVEKAKTNAQNVQVANTTPAPAPAAAATTPAAQAAAPAQPAPITLDQALAAIRMANADLGDMMGEMVAAGAVVRTTLVANIMANPNNPFTKEQLEAKKLGELQALIKLAGGAVTGSMVGNQAPAFNAALFFGNAGGAANPEAAPHTETPLMVKNLFNAARETAKAN